MLVFPITCKLLKIGGLYLKGLNNLPTGFFFFFFLCLDIHDIHQLRLVHSFCYRSVPVGLFSCNTKCKHKGMILFCGFISMTTQRERASERVGCQSHRVVGRWFAHLRIECETHVNVWVGVKRIEERVSMSQYENTLSVHLQEHLIRLAHQQTFFPPSFSLSPSLP